MAIYTIETFKTELEKTKKIASQISKQSIINSLEGMKERKSRVLILKFAEYPILFIGGKKDVVINYETLYPQVGACKYPYLVLLENAAHMGFYEAKKITLKKLELFAFSFSLLMRRFYVVR